MLWRDTSVVPARSRIPRSHEGNILLFRDAVGALERHMRVTCSVLAFLVRMRAGFKFHEELASLLEHN